MFNLKKLPLRLRQGLVIRDLKHYIQNCPSKLHFDFGLGRIGILDCVVQKGRAHNVRILNPSNFITQHVG